MYGERKEEYAIILDFMSSGKSFSTKAEPILQIIGEDFFTLLEAAPKEGAEVNIGERVYIGKEERDKVALIKSRIAYSQLTETAKSALPDSVLKIIRANEKRFTDFFNDAGPLNIREHSLELLPGIGKKNLGTILNARKERRFESFEDIVSRTKFIQDPAKIIERRVLTELEGNERFYLFTKPFQPRPQFGREERYGNRSGKY